VVGVPGKMEPCQLADRVSAAGQPYSSQDARKGSELSRSLAGVALLIAEEARPTFKIRSDLAEPGEGSNGWN
jgi:hypothetical protein